jgi:hypothetical protein
MGLGQGGLGKSSKRGFWGGEALGMVVEVEKERGLGRRSTTRDWRLGFSLWSVFLYHVVRKMNGQDRF